MKDHHWMSRRWHFDMQDKTFAQRELGMDTIRAVLPGGMFARSFSYYDEALILYVIGVTVYRHHGEVENSDKVFDHVEPFDVFPSDVLLTKIALITGGTIGA